MGADAKEPLGILRKMLGCHGDWQAGLGARSGSVGWRRIPLERLGELRRGWSGAGILWNFGDFPAGCGSCAAHPP